jgi:hypothetical protein
MEPIHPVVSQDEDQKPPQQHPIVDDGTPKENVTYHLDAHWSFSLAAKIKLSGGCLFEIIAYKRGAVKRGK